MPGEADIVGLSADSRAVRPGYLFAALPGARADGRAFIGEAIRRGAVAILAPPGTALDPAEPAIPLITDNNPRRRLALMAARFYGRQPKVVAAVTGTNGKTSVAEFTRQIWRHLGLPAASLGTLGVRAPDREEPLALTTLDPVALHRLLAELAEAGLDHLAFEASSHGLDQYRLDGVRVTAAAFTNLSRDHLDYHPDMESYLAAKARLFTTVMAPGGTAVLNADAPEWPALRALCQGRGHRVIGYGKAAHAVRGLRLDEVTPRPDGLELAASLFGRAQRARLGLIGAFQAWNALAALGLAIACGADARAAWAALPGLEGAPGRLQHVGDSTKGGAVYVDYAHTPGALETVLEAIRPHVRGRLLAVFGCGGDRDHGKRPLMGAVAARLADRAIVTDDNPRSEDPAAIRSAILAACPGAREIGDRGQAIRAGIAELGPGDVLVIAGKGHERGQIVGPETIPFDDAEVARRAIEREEAGS